MSWSFICRHLLSALHILFKQLNNSTNKQSGTHRTKLGADEGKNFHPSGWQFTEEFGGFWLSHATLTRKDKVPILSFLSRVKANETLFYSLFSCVYPRRNGCAFVGKDKQNDVNEDLHVPLLFLFLLAKYHRGGCCGFLLFQTDERKLVITCGFPVPIDFSNVFFFIFIVND